MYKKTKKHWSLITIIGLGFIFICVMAVPFFAFSNLPSDQKILMPILMFYSGIILHPMLLLSNIGFTKKNILGVFIALGFSLLGFIPGKHEYQYDFFFHSFVVAAIFIVTYISFFRKRLLVYVNKATVLLWNFVFLYIFFESFPFNNTAWGISAILALSSITALNLIFSLDKKKFWEIFFYVWFLVMLVCIGISHFTLGNLDFFFNEGLGPVASPFSMFLTGLTFLYVASNAVFVFMLIPMPGKGQTMKNRLVEVKAYIKELEEKYDSRPIGHKTFSIAILFGLFLLANYFLHFIPIAPFLPLLITILYVLDNYFGMAENDAK